jgi:hypothetical protein
MCASKRTVVIESGYLAAKGSLFLHNTSITNLANPRKVQCEGNGGGPS